MLATRRLRLAPEWDGRFTRMVVLSGFAHASVIVLILLLAARGGSRPLPMVAYTVELTDPNALGGRLPPGKIGTKPTPDAAPAAPAPGPPPAEETASVPAPPAPEPQPAPKVEPPKPEPPKAEAPKPDAVKIEPAKKPEPPKPAPKPVEKAEPKPPPKPVAEKPKPVPEKQPEPPKAAAEKPKPAPAPPPEKAAQAAKPAGGQNGPADADAKPKDAYAAAAERWRSKAQGQGLGGTDGGSGPIGTGGPGPGGGGQVVGIEFLAYRQRVIATVKGHWTNVVGTPGLVAAVRFEIAGDGTLGGIRLERSSGNAAYDSSVLRAVQRTEQLPPPPAKYAKEFGEFVIEFHSEEVGGKESG